MDDIHLFYVIRDDNELILLLCDVQAAAVSGV